MRVRFRGVDVREALLLEGPSGWGEFSPFVEYADGESARWLAARARGRVCRVAGSRARRRARQRDRPGRRPGPRARGARPLRRLHDGEGQGRRARPDARRRRRPCRRRPVRDGSGGAHPGRRQRRVGRRDRHGGADGGSRHTTSSTPSSRAPRVEELVELRTALARNGIDVLIAADESIRKAERPDPCRAARRRRHRRRQGGAARRRARGARDRRGVRPPGRRVVRTRHERRHRGRGGARRGAARRSTTPAGWARSASSSATSSATPCARRAGCWRPGVPSPTREALADLAAPPDRQQWWRDRLVRCHAVLDDGERRVIKACLNGDRTRAAAPARCR